MDDRLLNEYRLIKMRIVLVKQLDYTDINQIVDKLYSEAILTEAKRKVLYSTPQTEKEHTRDLLEILERRVAFEDGEGSTEIFDMFINELVDLDRKDLVEKLQNCELRDLQKIRERRKQSEGSLQLSEIRQQRELTVAGSLHEIGSNPEIESISGKVNNVPILNLEQRDFLAISNNDTTFDAISSQINPSLDKNVIAEPIKHLPISDAKCPEISESPNSINTSENASAITVTGSSQEIVPSPGGASTDETIQEEEDDIKMGRAIEIIVKESIKDTERKFRHRIKNMALRKK